MLPPERIEHPAAWIGKEMAQTPSLWTEDLSAAEIAELEDAAAAFLDSGTEIGSINPDHFALPRLGPKLVALLHTLKHGVGFRLIRGLPVERYDMDTIAVMYCGIGSYLGSARSQNAAGHILGHVKDVGGDLNDPKVRIYQTTRRQTFHTDSTDLVALLCLKEAMHGGDSLLCSTVTLYNEMRSRHPDLAPLLFETVPTDRRGEVPDGMKPWFEIPVLNWHEGYLTGLYQRQYIDSAARHDEAPRLSADHVKALDAWDALTNDPDLHLKMRLAPGDMQFVYNHHMLHDRTGFEDWPDPAERRHLLRLWLSLPEDRPLPPCFSQRYG
ncbi:MAG: TauD/TfdA family dioxygenase, partial [Pseudomonadota bacterium]